MGGAPEDRVLGGELVAVVEGVVELALEGVRSRRARRPGKSLGGGSGWPVVSGGEWLAIGGQGLPVAGDRRTGSGRGESGVDERGG